MSFLNKKILAAAVGAMFASGAAMAQTAQLPVTLQHYANEIVVPTGGIAPTAAAPLAWTSGYNYSPGEVKYVRVELTGATFASTFTGTPTVTGGTPGAINGLGTNVITFSVTSAAGITATSAFNVPLAGNINIPAKGNVSAKVSVYDTASQAQDGGSTGLLQIGSFLDTRFITFTPSYQFVNNARTSVASVGATPRYSAFAATAPDTAAVATLNTDLRVELVDVPGAQGAPYRLDGTSITLTDLFNNSSTIEIEGNFTGAGLVELGGFAATPAPSGTPARYPNRLTWTAANAGFFGAGPVSFEYNVPATARAIPASNFSANFLPVAASANYEVAPLSATSVGAIRRDGLELQAPFVQVPPAWTSRLVLTNTGSTAVAYSINVMSEDGNTNYTGQNNITGTIQPGTNVIDLQPIMTSFADMQRRRGSIVVQAEATDASGAGTIQGLLQIVNLQSNSITNHVLVRPGTN